jgi:arylformamidase
MQFYDVTLPIYTGMIKYPGDASANITQRRSIRSGDNCNMSNLELSSHTGTHIDAPLHFEENGVSVDKIPLDVLIGPAKLVDLEGVETVDENHLRDAGIEGHTRVLIRTSNCLLLDRPEFTGDYVSITVAAARYLVNTGIQLVGIDYLSVEKLKSSDWGVHHTLLGNGVVVIEGLDLREPPAGEYELICLPLPLRGCDGSPARVVLRGPL